MGKIRWFMLNVVLALAVMFTTAVTGCSTPTDTSPSPTVTAGPSPILTNTEPNSSATQNEEEATPGGGLSEEARESSRQLPPGVYILRDGIWIEVTVGSVIGQAIRTEEGGWYVPRIEGSALMQVGGADKAGGGVSHGVNPETGEIYIKSITWWTAEDLEAYYEYYGD